MNIIELTDIVKSITDPIKEDLDEFIFDFDWDEIEIDELISERRKRKFHSEFETLMKQQRMNKNRLVAVSRRKRMGKKGRTLKYMLANYLIEQVLLNNTDLQIE
jgi:hypothetical protein